MMYLGTEIFLLTPAKRVPVSARTDRVAPDPSCAVSSEILRTSVLSNPVSTRESRGTPPQSAVTRTLPGLEGEIATRYRTEGAEPQPARSAARRRRESKEKRKRVGMDVGKNAVDRRCHRSTT